MTLRFGLLGTGHWATVTQGAALAGSPAADFVGVWGRNPAKASALADTYGVRAYDDVDALLGDVDAVAVALPPDVQAGLATRAAEAGKHLLLDKPVALDLDTADRLVEAVDRAGVASVVFFTSRFRTPIPAALDDLARTGGWDSARATMAANIFTADGPYAGSTWRKEKGGLWDVGPHALSILIPVLGPVDRVVALGGPRHTSHLLLRHASGAVSTLELTLEAAPAAVTTEFVFAGTAGIVPLAAGTVSSVEAFGSAIGELSDLVAQGRTDHPCDVRFGRDVVAVLEQAEQAQAG